VGVGDVAEVGDGAGVSDGTKDIDESKVDGVYDAVVGDETVIVDNDGTCVGDSNSWINS